MNTVLEKPMHVGICKGFDSPYVITAEFMDGYVVMGRYWSKAAAKTALPKVKRFIAKFGVER